MAGRRGLLPGVSGVLKRDPLDREKLLTFVDIEKRNSMARARKKGITPLPCTWCEEPEEFEDMEA
ncbi:hypothetical protein GH153_03985 [bacterium]|nr:hypothetical protein [bacterium]